MTHQSYVPSVQFRDPGEVRISFCRRWRGACLEFSVNWYDRDTDAQRQGITFRIPSCLHVERRPTKN
eukprot:9493084-Lingulodinium_polyedra.AAC.1